MAELQRFAIDLVPALADVAIEKSWAGLRPGSPDGLPYMGQVPGWTNAFVAAGHFRAGFNSRLVRHDHGGIAYGSADFSAIGAFRLDRPPAPPVPSAFRS